VESIAVEYERTVKAPLETTRRTVLTALEKDGFHVTRSQGGLIDARRGSDLRMFEAGRRPVRASVSVVGHDGVSRIAVRLADLSRVPLGSQSLGASYWPVFQEVHDQIDGWLLSLDPGVQTDPLPAPQQSVAVRSVSVTFVIGDHVAVLAPDDVDMYQSVSSMVIGTPGALPPGPAAQIEELALVLRRATGSAAGISV
jgi:hypothetical protein